MLELNRDSDPIQNIPELLDRKPSDRQTVLYNVLQKEWNVEYHKKYQEVAESICHITQNENRISSLAYALTWEHFSEIGIEGFALQALTEITSAISEALQVKDGAVTSDLNKKQLVEVMTDVFGRSAKFVTT
jgi:hypothetical protein